MSFKSIFWLWLPGAIVFWLVPDFSLLYYTIGSAVVIGVFYFILEHLHNDTIEQKRLADQAAAKAKAKQDMLLAMTKEERQALAEKERAEEERQEREWKLAQREAALKRKERELAKLEREEKRKGKVPLSAKLATSAVVGYKVGKKIGKW